GGADRDVRGAAAPGPPDGVGHQHPEGEVEPGAQAAAEASGGGVGVLGQEQGRAGGDVRGVDAGGRGDEAVAGLDDAQHGAVGALPADDLADALGVDRGLAVRGGHQPALGAGDDLRGDDHDVAVDQPGRTVGPGQRGERGGQQGGDVVAGGEGGQPL